MELLQTHHAKNISEEYLLKFYKTFGEIEENRYDGMIVTGAPVEQMPFERVDYWPELCRILDWSEANVWSVLHICWGAQAGLYRLWDSEACASAKAFRNPPTQAYKSESFAGAGI